MLNIKIICVGKLKEKFYLGAAAEYTKRLGAHCRLEVEELPESRLPAQPSPGEVEAALKKEGESIALRIPDGALTVALCVEGRELDSVRFALVISVIDDAADEDLECSRGAETAADCNFALDIRIKPVSASVKLPEQVDKTLEYACYEGCCCAGLVI